MLLVRISMYLKSRLRYTFLISDTYHREMYVHMSKDVRIRGYFSKPKGVREEESVGNTALRLL
jgi:hypothetical protein